MLNVNNDVGSDHEDEGQWLTQGSKQVCLEEFNRI